MEKRWKCKLCEQTFAEIPPDAELISGGRSSKLYRFSDGQLHELAVVQDPHRWHVRKKMRFGNCKLCNPKQVTDDSIKTESVQQEVATVKSLDTGEADNVSGSRDLSSDIHEEEPEQSVEPEPQFAAMAHAFRNIRSK